MIKSGHINDCWSAYRYGSRIKIIYHKRGRLSQNAFEKSKRLKYLEQLEDERVKYWAPHDIDGEVTPWGEAHDILEDRKKARLSQSVIRTRGKIFEIALCNSFEWFCTLTLDGSKIDRNDLSSARKAISQFIRDENKKRSETQKIEYLIIPERHENGAWHFHGLFKGLVKGQDLTRNEHGYLDWSGYRRRFGFFSCSRIKSQEACSRYITKYVTKGLNSDNAKATNLEAGQHSYFASQGLKRREVIEKLCSEKIGFFDPEMSENWSFENEYIKIAWLTIDPKTGALALDNNK